MLTRLKSESDKYITNHEIISSSPTNERLLCLLCLFSGQECQGLMNRVINWSSEGLDSLGPIYVTLLYCTTLMSSLRIQAFHSSKICIFVSRSSGCIKYHRIFYRNVGRPSIQGVVLKVEKNSEAGSELEQVVRLSL